MKKTIFIAMALLGTAAAQAETPFHDIPKETSSEIKVTSFAVRPAFQDENTSIYWNNRREAAVKNMTKNDPDILLIQEAEWGQMLYIDDCLPKAYARVDYNPNTDEKEKSEFTCIYYKSEQFSVVRSGHFWLSETPDKPSLGWNAASTMRDVNWAVLKDKSTGKDILVACVHMEWARKFIRHAFPLIQNRLHEISGYTMPTIVGGEFFVDNEDELAKDFLKDYQDAVTACRTSDKKNSFNDFGLRFKNTDHIYYRGFKGATYITQNAKVDNVQYTSDHYPIFAILEY